MKRLVGVAIGVFFLMSSVWQHRQQQAFLEQALTGEGTVTKVFHGRNKEYDGYVRFQESSGRTREALVSSGLSTRLQAGQRIRFRYLPGTDDPVQMDDEGSRIVWALGAFGALLVLTSLFASPRRT